MRKQTIFTIDINTIERLNKTVSRGHRSRFVETAIKNRLNNEEEYKPQDVSTRQLMAILHARLSERNDAAAEMMKVFIMEELR